MRKSNVGPEEIEAEARKGYDFLIIGVGETRASKGGFAESVSEIATDFAGPVAIVDTHGTATDRLLKELAKIVVPVNGTEVSRRAAEVAFTLARASDAQVTVLYVTSPPDAEKARPRAEPCGTPQRQGGPEGYQCPGETLFGQGSPQYARKCRAS